MGRWLVLCGCVRLDGAEEAVLAVPSAAWEVGAYGSEVAGLKEMVP